MPAGEPATDQTYTVDNDAPGLASFIRQTPASSPTNADSLVFRVTFDEGASGVGTADFAVNGTTTATVTGVLAVSASVYDVTVSGGDLAGFNGAVGLNLAASQNITDLAGNALPAGEPGSTLGTGTISNDDSAQFTVDSVSGSENAGSLTFTVTLSNPVDMATSVQVSTSNGTALASDGDYTAVANRTLDFAAGETSKTFQVTPTADNKVELDETFTVSLGNVSAGGRDVTAGSTPGTGTITNDDSAQFTVDSVSGAENAGPLTFTVTLSNPVDAAVAVEISTADGTATVADNDYRAETNSRVNFAAGETSKTFQVTLTSDRLAEPDETFSVSLSNVSDAGRNVTASGTAGTGTITNDDTNISVTVSPGSMVEDQSGAMTFTFSRTGLTASPLSVSFSVAGTAAFGTDYTQAGAGTFAAGSGTVAFAAGATSATVTIDPAVDSVPEGNETVTLTVVDGTGYTAGSPASATATILTDEFDYGDAPPSYPTKLADDGARHAPSGPTLGANRDAETNGQPNTPATGDDTNGSPDDEDGVVFLTGALIASETTATIAKVQVTLRNADSSSNRLDAWIDFNQDEDWLDPGEQIFTDFSLGTTNGTQTLDFTVPAGTPSGTTHARFRLSTAGNLGLTGLANDGEVEDYRLTLLPGVSVAVSPAAAATGVIETDEFDFADAPSSYPTTLEDDGPRHQPIGPTLGSNRDVESDGQSDANALGDDGSGTLDDEDGVRFGSVRLGQPDVTFRIDVQNAPTGARLDGWVDWNANGDWDDDGEQVAANLAVVNGENVFSVALPATAGVGTTFARFRVSSAGNLAVTGEAADGEVEDYKLTIVEERSGIADWTVMVYMTASNLGNFAREDLGEMERAVSVLPETVKLAVLLDRTPGPANNFTTPVVAGQPQAWTTTGRAIVRPDASSEVDTPFELLEEKDTGAAVTLTDFIAWASQTAPAQHYALVMWDHGSGLRGMNFDSDGPAAANELETSELVSALSAAAVRFELVAFDECAMAMAEIAHAFAGLTDVMVASQEAVPGTGFDYETALAALESDPAGATAASIAAGMVSSYQTTAATGSAAIRQNTLAAVELDQIGDLATALGGFTAAVLGSQPALNDDQW